MKCAELMVSSPEMLEDVLENNLFLAVGSLYLTLDYGDFDEYEEVSDNMTKMFTAIAESRNSQLQCLQLHELVVDPKALGKAVCVLPTVEIAEICWRNF